MYVHMYVSPLQRVRSSGLGLELGSFGSLLSVGHTYMPDPDQNYLVVMCIENFNEKI